MAKKNEEYAHPVPCRSCGAMVRFLKTENRKIMPIDRDPNPKGNLTVEKRGESEVVVYIGKPDVEPNLFEGHGIEPTRYTSHFVTCPGASGWRR